MTFLEIVWIFAVFVPHGRAAFMRSACYDSPPRYIGCPVGSIAPNEFDTAYDVKFFYNVTTAACQPFYFVRVVNTAYSCMLDSQNLFDSEDDCDTTCSWSNPWSATTTTAKYRRTTVEPSAGRRLSVRCLEPLYLPNGVCQSQSPIYTYDAEMGKCVVIAYAGCSSNVLTGNRFTTIQECQQSCMRDSMDRMPAVWVRPLTTRKVWITPSVPTTKPPTTTTSTISPVFSRYPALMVQQAKPRSMYSANPRCNSATYVEVYGNTSCSDHPKEVRFQYNVLRGKCERFTYTGCRQVIVNMFNSIWECQRSCEEAKHKPLLNKQSLNDDCPSHSYIASCSVNPCVMVGCPNWPAAECRPNYCGGCSARFYINNREVDCVNVARLILPAPSTPKPTTTKPSPNDISPSTQSLAAIISVITDLLPPPYPRTWFCLPHTRLILCSENPCKSARACLRYPLAQCQPDYCGGCIARYYVRGVIVDCS